MHSNNLFSILKLHIHMEVIHIKRSLLKVLTKQANKTQGMLC